MADWNPALYSRFEAERTRPAIELLARVPLSHAATVVDLGCGPGNSTELLVARFPEATITGMDSSPAMIAEASARVPTATFEQADIATWSRSNVDLIYANAALQWVPDHETLIPRLVAMLAPGGVLAVQVPDNLAEPSHVAMRETAGEAPFASTIGALRARRDRTLSPDRYYDLLATTCEVDVWRTTYFHVMPDIDAIVQWVRATGLKSFVDALPGPLHAPYLAAYAGKLETAYPARSDGSRLLAFPRLSFVATRARTSARA